MLLRPPTLAGPGGMPLIGILPDPAAPAIRAKEVDGAPTRRSARTILAEMFDMMRLQVCLTGLRRFAMPDAV
jgi:hypothetical protein